MGICVEISRQVSIANIPPRMHRSQRIPEIVGLPAHYNLSTCLQKGVGRPSRSFTAAPLSGIEAMALLISSKVILSHFSLTARCSSSGSVRGPQLFNLCFNSLQMLSVGFKSGDSAQLASHWIPRWVLACLTLLSAFPRVISVVVVLQKHPILVPIRGDDFLQQNGIISLCKPATPFCACVEV